MKSKSKKDNYMDFIPVHNPKNKWDVNEDEEVTIYIENKGFFNFIAQKLLKKPRISQIHLEGLGNYVWTQIDGERTVYDIGLRLKDKFGEDAEPLFPRLVTYIKYLESYGFISVRQEPWNVRIYVILLMGKK